MKKGRKVNGRLEARRKAFKTGDNTVNGFARRRPGSLKKSWPKTASRGTQRRSHGAKPKGPKNG